MKFKDYEPDSLSPLLSELDKELDKKLRDCKVLPLIRLLLDILESASTTPGVWATNGVKQDGSEYLITIKGMGKPVYVAGTTLLELATAANNIL